MMLRLTAAWLIASCCCGAWACWTGGNETGSLRFTGAVESTEFTGEFGRFDVRFCFDGPRPEQGTIEVRVELGSAESGNQDRDQTMKGDEFFAIDRFPESSWRSTSIVPSRDGYRADGELTLKGVTRPQSIRFDLSPDGEALVAQGEFVLAGSADVDRQRFDVGTGDFADPDFVRNRVDVAFDVRLRRASVEAGGSASR